jgi:hypothetical protein
MSRSSELLKAAADALDDGSDPFSSTFLDANRVTLDECFDLAEWLALGSRLMAWAIENPRQARTAVEGATGAMTMDKITRILQKMNEQAARR